MRIYIAIIDDTHADTEAYAFSTAEDAIAFAKSCAKEYAYKLEDIEEETIEGWLYYARYSPESKVWVTERELDET